MSASELRVDVGATALSERWRHAAIASVAYVALILTTFALTRDGSAVAFLLFVGAANVAAAFACRTEEARTASLLFALAMVVRSIAALAFHAAAVANNDPFRGSPDAWSYYSWASSLAFDFRHGWFPGISAYYQTGRWDVGYYYVLGAVYAIFGSSLLVGRLAGALFGALAVLLLLRVAVRFVPEKLAVAIAVVYALWPMSIGWATETILRDSFVWFLLLAATLFVARFLEVPTFRGWCALVVVISVLRYTRIYAAYFIYGALGIALALSILSRSLRPRITSRAVPLVALLIVVELFFISFGFPNAVQSVRAYNLPHWIEHEIPTKTVHLPTLRPNVESGSGVAAAPPQATPLPPVPRPDIASEPEETTAGSPSLAGNAVRLVLAPFGWTFFLPGHSIWPVYSVWPWYLLVPAAAIGAIVLLKRGVLLPRVVVIATAVYMAALGVVGRGDAIRQRETAVPFLIMIAFAGIASLRNRRRVLVPVYVVWIALLAGGIAYHIHSLRGRRFSPEGLPLPPIRPVAASSQVRATG